MDLAPHIARLRAVVGHDALLLPSVSAPPTDAAGRVLLVRQAGHGDGRGILGGPDYEVSYPNGDRVAYVTAVYEARVVTGFPAVNDSELSELAWFGTGELPPGHLTACPRRRERSPGFLRPARQNGPDRPPSLRLAESGQLH